MRGACLPMDCHALFHGALSLRIFSQIQVLRHWRADLYHVRRPTFSISVLAVVGVSCLTFTSTYHRSPIVILIPYRR
jgi:hypothetical protein